MATSIIVNTLQSLVLVTVMWFVFPSRREFNELVQRLLYRSLSDEDGTCVQLFREDVERLQALMDHPNATAGDIIEQVEATLRKGRRI